MKWFRFLLVSMALLTGAARADIAIEIVGVGSQQYPIAIAPFRGEVSLPQSLTSVIGNDLNLSGLFRVINAGDMAPVPYQPSEVNSQALAARGAQTVLVGQVGQAADGYKIRFWLLEAATRRELIAMEVTAQAKQLRRTAHQIADMIYEKITGEPGAFNSRIAYVIKHGGRNELQVADSDGYGAQTILTSKEPILTPKWSPDGSTLAYVSFEKQKPVVFTHHLQSGRRVAVAAFRGNNSAPAWSPDGSQLAVALTKDGGTNVYLINAHGGAARRLTFGGEINTEPSWTPDGKAILFTSDRGGSPQIYRQSILGNGAERMTFTGGYNASAKMSPDGKLMTFVARDNGAYRVAVMDVATKQVMVLTDTPDDDSPSFSPNGRMILYEAVVDRKRSLAVVSSDGRVKQRLRALAGEVRQPAWGPLLK
ncbi:TolB protein [Formivibrio citricus]|uniref:Tol-Pal system protein TolB n=1 Tax=Formivibrio citricus TaxID=83765 RepID=A0A1I4ZH93_9NEIS|nr:Tol-Pal system beta propeller repeat protein TolB [Formivibrio citricus]SFN49641.1 TolB protein [Formivibrio citricus]